MFLDTLGIAWDYEREGFELPSGKYLPDFWLPTPGSDGGYGDGFWLEIKPVEPSELERTLCFELSTMTEDVVYLAYGDFSRGLAAIKFGPMRVGESFDNDMILQYWLRFLASPSAPHWSTAQHAARAARFNTRQNWVPPVIPEPASRPQYESVPKEWLKGKVIHQ